MRKIKFAWIEQILEFDSKLEYLTYIAELEQSGRKFKEIEQEQDISGKVSLRIRKQYNNNQFPED